MYVWCGGAGEGRGSKCGFFRLYTCAVVIVMMAALEEDKIAEAKEVEGEERQKGRSERDERRSCICADMCRKGNRCK